MAIDDQARVVLNNIQNRRTMPWNRLKPDPLAAEHVDALLEAANWAPSHRHTEPWRFWLFQGEGRQKIADLLAETYKDFAGDAYLEKKYVKCQVRPVSVPLVIAVIMKPSRQPVMPEFEEMLAMGCAVQNMHLAAQALGIGFAWSTPGYLEHPSIRQYFDLEDGDRCLGFLYLGYAADAFPTSKRGAVADKVVVIDQ